MFFCTFTFSKSETISAKEAVFYIGKSVVACAKVKEVAIFSKGTYLNLDDRYPNQSLTIVIWDDRKESVVRKLGDLNLLEDVNICVSGKVSDNNCRHQIVLNTSHAIRKDS